MLHSIFSHIITRRTRLAKKYGLYHYGHLDLRMLNDDAHMPLLNGFRFHIFDFDRESQGVQDRAVTFHSRVQRLDMLR